MLINDTTMPERLIVSEPYYFSDSSSHCGYCRGQKSDKNNFFAAESWYDKRGKKQEVIDVKNCTLGVQLELIPVGLYDKFCNMGFRRSGKFLYKSDPFRNCCRMYTIRTTAEEVQMSKDLKTCIKRFKKAVLPERGDKGNKKDSKESFNFMKEIIDVETGSKNFYTRFEPPLYSDEKYQLFAKYQEGIHKDFDHNPKSFKRFLCDTPFSLEVVRGTEQEWEELNDWRNPHRVNFGRVGPAHECYYYNGNLIAMAVIDILPSGISSVYFIWDPEYRKMSLGKLSALRELTISNKIKRKYYYMGYFIEDCVKMNYKAKYGGELLDLCNHKYALLSKLEEEIDHGKFFVLSNDPNLNRELHLNQRFSKSIVAQENPDELYNVVENIYGVNGGAFRRAEDAAKQLSMNGIPYNGSENDNYSVPNVVPGLLPLDEILEMVLRDELGLLDNRLTVFDTSAGYLRQIVHFSDELPHIKRTICDLIRLFGLQNTVGSLIVI